jgi:hypothetical protein
VVVKEARQAAYILHCSGYFKKSDWGHSDIFKVAMEDFLERSPNLWIKA